MPRSRAIYTAVAGTALALFCLGPLAWLFRASVTPEREIYRHPAAILPDAVTFDHYRTVLVDPSVWLYLGNSVLFATAATVLAMAFAVPAAYAIARGRFRGKSVLLAGMLAVHLLPAITSVTALYRLVDAATLLDTLTGLVLVRGGSLTLVVWLLAGYIRGIPTAVEDAALLDGASGIRLLTRVVVPAAGPGVAAASLLLFLGNWNAFFLPYVLLRSPEKMTAAVGIYQYVGEHGTRPGPVAAMTLVVIAPVLALLWATRRLVWTHMVRGAR